MGMQKGPAQAEVGLRTETCGSETRSLQQYRAAREATLPRRWPPSMTPGSSRAPDRQLCSQFDSQCLQCPGQMPSCMRHGCDPNPGGRYHVVTGAMGEGVLVTQEPEKNQLKL